MANGINPEGILSQLRRSPRNLLEYADLARPMPERSTAEVVTDTVGAAVERAGGIYLQGKQLDNQLQIKMA